MPDTEDRSASSTATAAPPQPAAGAAPQEQPAPPKPRVAKAQPPTPATDGAPAAVEAAPAAPDWRAAIEGAPVDELRTHPRFNAIVGGAVDQALRRAKAEWERETSARMSRETEARVTQQMREQAAADPVGFAQAWLSHAEARDTTERVNQARSEIEATTRAAEAHRFAAVIGHALGGLPEYQALSSDEKADLARAVDGIDDPAQLFGTFLPAVLGKTAARKAESIYTDRHAKDLDKEVEARIKEREAKRRAAQARPDLRAPSASPQEDLAHLQMDDKAFSAWYEKEYLGKL